MNMKKLGYIFMGLACALAFSCSVENDVAEGDWSSYKGVGGDYAYLSDDMISPGGGSGNGGEAGVITAGEWNDLDNWSFWKDIINGQNQTFSQMATDWGFFTGRRYAVKVTDEGGMPAVNAKVQLLEGQETVWASKTDVFGRCDLWENLYTGGNGKDGLKLSINGVEMEGSPVVTTFDSTQVHFNEYTVSVSAPESKADIAFIVDATGSMGDEIAFLKKDLLDILEKARQDQRGITFRTGTVFYRDAEDAQYTYLTRYSPFTEDFSTTINFIKNQSADGGGDLPEAVHTALEVGLNELAWDDGARSRIAFLLLDAPAHQDRAQVISSLHQSIYSYSARGIKIIPIFASSGDKSCEFMCRFFAIATGGTYVFLTNDSGIGESHVVPSVGQYQVEKLNDLVLRLIVKYTGIQSE